MDLSDQGQTPGGEFMMGGNKSGKKNGHKEESKNGEE